MSIRTIEQQKRWQAVEQIARPRCIHNAPEMGQDTKGNPAQKPL